MSLGKVSWYLPNLRLQAPYPSKGPVDDAASKPAPGTIAGGSWMSSSEKINALVIGGESNALAWCLVNFSESEIEVGRLLGLLLCQALDVATPAPCRDSLYRSVCV